MEDRKISFDDPNLVASATERYANDGDTLKFRPTDDDMKNWGR